MAPCASQRFKSWRSRVVKMIREGFGSQNSPPQSEFVHGIHLGRARKFARTEKIRTKAQTWVMRPGSRNPSLGAAIRPALSAFLALRPQIQNVNIRSQPRVIHQVPPIMIRIGIEHDVITTRLPVASIVVIVRRDL